MTASPVEWALIVYYGPEAHRATYGRKVQSNRYTKDFIQLSRKLEFVNAAMKVFDGTGGEAASVPLVYRWPTGSAPGAFVFHSGDRPHLKWETSLGAPQAWKMSTAPSDATPETIPGDPSHRTFAGAEKELTLLASRGAGQPYLMAIKLWDEPRTLHLRAYLANPSAEYDWANIQLAPKDIESLANRTSQRSTLAWSGFQSGGVAPDESISNALSQLNASDTPSTVIDTLDEDTARALANYLLHPGYGLFFDPAQNHDAWSQLDLPPDRITTSVADLLELLHARYPAYPVGDAAAEKVRVSADEVQGFREQIKGKNYEVADSHATVKTRGSAQKAFAMAVKPNYGFRCAITGIATKDFLVASHIVPWSQDQSIRLDPSNGICLSLLMDRAFETGYLTIDDRLTVRVDWPRVGDDEALRRQLEPYDGKQLAAPKKGKPKLEYLQRRRALVAPIE